MLELAYTGCGINKPASWQDKDIELWYFHYDWVVDMNNNFGIESITRVKFDFFWSFKWYPVKPAQSQTSPKSNPPTSQTGLDEESNRPNSHAYKCVQMFRSIMMVVGLKARQIFFIGIIESVFLYLFRIMATKWRTYNMYQRI